MSILGGVSLGLGALDTAVNFGLGMKNYELQKDNLEYQKQQQNITRDREDNSIQRRVADLRAAGLSPTLAAGSGATASAPISTVAPQINANIDTQGKLAQSLALMQAKQNIARTNAEMDLIAMQRDKTQEDTIGSHLSNIRTEMENNARGFDIEYLERKNLSPNSSGWTRDAVNLINAMEKLVGVDIVDTLRKIPGALSKIEVEPLKLPNVGNILGNAVQETAGKVKEGVSEKITQTKQSLESTKQKISDGFSKLNEESKTQLKKNPLFSKLIDALEATNRWQKGGK